MIKLRQIVDNVYERQQNGKGLPGSFMAWLRIIIISGRRQTTIINVLAAVLLPFSTAIAGDRHDYAVMVDAELRQLTVLARFGVAVSDISARSGTARQFLIEANDCDTGKRIQIRGRRMLPIDSGVRCLKYSVDLEQAARAERRNESLHDSNIVISPAVWMWRPPLGADDEIRVRFDLPGDVGVSVPWQRVDSSANTYLLTASPRSGFAMLAFGRFETFVAHVADDELAITLLRSTADVAAAPIIEWIRDTANILVLAYGRFPNPNARVLVFPVEGDPGRGESAVHFGRVVRDGGETVELLIDPGQPIEMFYEDWAATHEFAHLMLPYVDSEQRWISEGFAQYYQNLLLARAGRYTQQYAWQKLHDGLARGRESVPGLSPNEAASREERNSRMKIYWSGAALALMADVELRRRSNGVETLDVVLDQFQRCCLPSRRSWSGLELFAKFDSFLDEPLFLDLYQRYADTAGFPDTAPLLKRLGVVLDGAEIQLSDDAELAEILAMLTARRYTGRPDR